MDEEAAACEAALNELEEAASALLLSAAEIVAPAPPPPPPLGLEKWRSKSKWSTPSPAPPERRPTAISITSSVKKPSPFSSLRRRNKTTTRQSRESSVDKQSSSDSLNKNTGSSSSSSDVTVIPNRAAAAKESGNGSIGGTLSRLKKRTNKSVEDMRKAFPQFYISSWSRTGSASNPATPAAGQRTTAAAFARGKNEDGGGHVSFGDRMVRQELMLARSSSADRSRGGEFSSDDDEETPFASRRRGGHIAKMAQFRGKCMKHSYKVSTRYSCTPVMSFVTQIHLLPAR